MRIIYWWRMPLFKRDKNEGYFACSYSYAGDYGRHGG